MKNEMKCPFPCGWGELNRIVTQKAAYFAVATLDDDIPEEVRQSGVYAGKVALELIKHARHIPEGYALVPVIPTREMIDAWRVDQNQNRSLESSYLAMIKAAQESEE